MRYFQFDNLPTSSMQCWWYVWLIFLFPVTDSIKPYVMQSVVLDSADGSTSPPVVVKGLSGYILSHDPIKAKSYRPDRRYFLTIDAPENYRIQIQMMHFDLGYPKGTTRCRGDSLFLFNNQLESDQVPVELTSSLGEMIGEYCYNKNRTVLAVSSKHSLILYWHTVSLEHRYNDTKGFVLKWTVFKSHDGTCSETNDFICTDGQMCIPNELACDSVAHCIDESDLNKDRRATVGCENIQNIESSTEEPTEIPPDQSFNPSAVAGIIVAVILALILAVTVIVCCCLPSGKKGANMESLPSASALTTGVVASGCQPPPGRYANFRTAGSGCVSGSVRKIANKSDVYDCQRLNETFVDSYGKRPRGNCNYYYETDKCII